VVIGVARHTPICEMVVLHHAGALVRQRLEHTRQAPGVERGISDSIYAVLCRALCRT
jgi:hypothetical protein